MAEKNQIKYKASLIHGECNYGYILQLLYIFEVNIGLIYLLWKLNENNKSMTSLIGHT